MPAPPGRLRRRRAAPARPAFARLVLRKLEDQRVAVFAPAMANNATMAKVGDLEPEKGKGGERHAQLSPRPRVKVEFKIRIRDNLERTKARAQRYFVTFIA